jgi:dihydropteroate synthase|tara:strand:- start:2533 stop:3336 length:804 start_codon:yes stop_codon:yes gene_type:complete
MIMGVVNVTPDSFSDGGSYLDPQVAIDRAKFLFEAGADIVDVGGESTRPGAEPVSLQLERERVIPVVQELSRLGVPLSIDTQKPILMEEAIECGACLINDISGAQDPEVASIVARTNVGLCVTHMQGSPRVMQQNPSYQDVIQEVFTFLQERVLTLIRAGVNPSNIVVDPGFGFGKTFDHNLALLGNLNKFRALGHPILVGLSRKAMLGAITNKEDPLDRLGSSIASVIFAVTQGAEIVRVHDVNETKDAILAWQYFSEAMHAESEQ